MNGKHDEIGADIPQINSEEAYLSSYRVYQGPQDGPNGIPLSDLSKIRDNGPFIQERPSSYRTLSCVSAFLCFCPVGIAALCYSLRSKWAKEEGEFSKSRVLGKNARDIAIASIVLGIFLLLVGVLVVILLWKTVGFK